MHGVPPSASIVIANWNGRLWLEKCLPAVNAQSYRDFEIIVVDNGSDDGSAAWLMDRWPEVLTVELESNRGFAAANNEGIRRARGRFIITLNNDTLVDPRWLEALVDTAEGAGLGMVASQIVNWQRPEILDSAGLEVDLAGIAWNRGWGQLAEAASTPCQVFGPSAAAALYSRDMLEKIGLFDEAFFAYYEDVDLAWRAQRAGWRCGYAPDARVRHWHSATGQRDPDRKLFLLGRNKVWAIAKNYSWPALLWALPLIVAYDFIAVTYQITVNRSLAALYGRFSALRRLRPMLAKRIPGEQVTLAAPVPPWKLSTRSNTSLAS